MAVIFWIRLDQICSKWIKLDKIGFLPNVRKIFQLDHRDLVQIGSNQVKLDQIGSNWLKLDWIRPDQLGTN